MLIKLQQPFSIYARHTEKKIKREISFAEKVKIDRMVIAFLFLFSVILTVLLS
jgi:hypothetical protein